MSLPAELKQPRPAAWRRLVGSRPLWLIVLSLGVTCWALSAPLYLDAVSRIGLNPDLRQLGHLWDRLIYPPSEHFNFDRNDPSRPVVFALYTLIWQLSPNDPLGFTLCNLLLHALNAVLAYLCCRWVLRRLWPERPPEAGAFVAAALFALSPLNVGTAIYSYALTDVLALTFSLVTMIAFVRASPRAAGRSAAAARPWRWRVIAALSLVAGLFSKQSLAVMPLALLVCDYFLLAERRVAAMRPHALTHLGLLGIVAAYLAWRLSYFGLVGDVEGVHYLWNRWEYLTAQPEVVLRYLGGLFVPTDLSIDHAFGRHLPASWLPRVLVPWALVLALLAATLRLASAPGAFAAAAASALLWFFVQLAPTSSLMPTVDAMVERRVYVPSVGLYLFLVLAYQRGRHAARADHSALPPRLWRYGGAVLAGVVLCAFGLVSVQRSYRFRDPIATWRGVVALYPDSPRALSNLGAALLERRHYREAHALFQRATTLQSAAFSDWYNLADIYERPDSGFYDPARATLMYRRALVVNPGYALVFFRLARLLQLRGELDEAREFYRRSIAAGLEPVDSYNNLGLIELDQGHLAAAREAFQQALALAPGYERARLNLQRVEQLGAGAQGGQ